MCYCYLHQSKPFLKHLEIKTCGWHNDRHSENCHCRVWARIKILVSSIIQELWPYVTPRRASSSYRLYVHTFFMHVPGRKIGSLHPRSPTLDWEKLENEEWGPKEAHCLKEIESIKCEVARLLDLLEQVLGFKNGKGTSTQPPGETLLVHISHKENIIDFSP
jgi:hypothetical protein